MLIHPWDAALDREEWQTWLAATDGFGVIVVPHVDPAQAPLVLPTHVSLAGDEILAHLARPNPVWPHLEAAARVRVAFVGDYAYVPSTWRAAPDGPTTDGVPTSYYTSVQFVCTPTIVDDAHEKAALLTTQLGDVQPEGGHAEVSVEGGPYGRMLPGIRGLRLRIESVEAKFKYDDAKPVGHRERVSGLLEERGRGTDAGAAAQQRRRLARLGEWSKRRG